uniref:hypothetical protein n=1 Tax=Thaumasiovibrio occultus TaxID=1891184 RepID=UPI000B3587F6|nr:hypothetical protein [Thaumasiovibrio occultus]
MNYRWICGVGVVALFLSGCSRIQDIQKDCFQPFAMLATDYFGTEAPHIWNISGNSAGDEFLQENDVLGYIVSDGMGNRKVPLNDGDVLQFTGRVYMIWPSWPEKYLGGSTKNIQYEVVVGDGKYLIFDESPRNKHLPFVQRRCDF